MHIFWLDTFACLNHAYAIIGLHVKDFHLNTVASTESAKELCDIFEATSKSKNNAKKLLLRRDITSLEKQANEPLTKFVARGKAIWSALVATGYECLSKNKKAGWAANLDCAVIRASSWPSLGLFF